MKEKDKEETPKPLETPTAPDVSTSDTEPIGGQPQNPPGVPK